MVNGVKKLVGTVNGNASKQYKPFFHHLKQRSNCCVWSSKLACYITSKHAVWDAHVWMLLKWANLLNTIYHFILLVDKKILRFSAYLDTNTRGRRPQLLLPFDVVVCTMSLPMDISHFRQFIVMLMLQVLKTHFAQIMLALSWQNRHLFHQR